MTLFVPTVYVLPQQGYTDQEWHEWHEAPPAVRHLVMRDLGLAQ